jgi:hypothetical protein
MRNNFLAIGLLLLALAPLARADFSGTFGPSSPGWQNGGVIPDGSFVGWSDTRAVSGLAGAITDVTVTLNLSGGWNGDLYAYLTHGDGFAVLLNRVGRSGTSGLGYGDAGMNVTLDDTALVNIHNYEGGFVPTLSYQSDGRNVNPVTGNLTPLGSGPATLSAAFGGMTTGNGNWTLFVADVSGGDVSTVTSWGLEIAAVPEPASLIEGSVAVLFLGGVVWLYRRKRAKAQPQLC